MKKVIFETILSAGGGGHYIDDHRCGGEKPSGGGSVTYRAELSAADIVRALESTKHGKAALDAYVRRAAQADKEGAK